jgi:hypothetical protein
MLTCDVITYFGGKKEACAALCISRQAIESWGIKVPDQPRKLIALAVIADVERPFEVEPMHEKIKWAEETILSVIAP